MRVFKAGRDLIDDRPGMRTRHRRGLKSPHQIAQEFAFQQLQREKVDVSVPIHVIDLHDARVRQGLCGLQLAPQGLDRFISVSGALVKQLDRNISLRRRPTGPQSVQGFEYGALAAGSYTLLDVVSSPLRASTLTPPHNWVAVGNAGS